MKTGTGEVMIFFAFAGEVKLLQRFPFWDLHQEPQSQIGKYITGSQGSVYCKSTFIYLPFIIVLCLNYG